MRAVYITASVMVALWALPAAAATPGLVRIEAPHVRQKPDFCGEACVEMALRQAGHPLSQDEVFNRSGVEPALGRGCITPELAAVMARIGFAEGPLWAFVRATRAATEMETQWRALYSDLTNGLPSIVCMHYDDAPATTEHFRLIVGYDPAADEVLYHEPAEDNGAYRRMRKERFLQLWPLKYEARRWTVVRLRCAPGRWRDAPPRAAGFTPADFAQHVMALRARVGLTNLSVAVAPPFVVLGDEPAAVVAQRAEQTVAWAVRQFKRLYFRDDPDRILDVWLFKDAASYERHCREWFHLKPTTPFGFFAPEHDALIMDIGTGGGTLVHEIVHPFMRANFPACPAWFNEGLGSLYEQSEERYGGIRGLTNWRLAGLQTALKDNTVPSFQTLLATSDTEFYNDNRGIHYAQARYLCYYLQERKLLVKFYREFSAHRADDPTGVLTLRRILGQDDLDAFMKTWRTYVLGLTFP